MFTDVAGYTALAQRDERLNLELLEDHRTLIRPLVQHCEGVEVKTMGDGFLIEFPSALQAVRCAVEVQRALRAHASTQPATRTLRVRIGVHLGDVERREGDILGNGVNIASRIMPLAEPGGICVSSQVYDQVENKLQVKFACLGPQTLKHIARPVEVYRVVHPWEERPPNAEPRKRTAPPAMRSIAVLPFANMSADPENEYFCDGLTEDILAQLAKIGSLKVISRTSVMRYKGRTDKPLREIAEELVVGTILEGTARKVGDRVRIVAQLIDAASDGHIWAETYDRDLTDIFAIQSEVAQAIARALQATITGAERDRIEKRPTKSLEAYTLVLQVRFDLNISWPHTKQQLEQAIQTFQRAIGLDPDYAQAYSELADMYRFLAHRSRNRMEGRETEAEWLAKAEAAARRALELDDTLAEAHYAAGALARDRLDWAEAERSYRRALELNPNTALAHASYAKMLEWHGRIDEALEYILRARELDPNSIDAWNALMDIYHHARQYERVLEEMREFLQRFPDAARHLHWITGSALFWLARYEEALAEFKLFREQAPESEHKDCVAEIALAATEERLGKQGVLRKTLERWEAEPDRRKVWPLAMAVGYVLSEDHERALDWLESGYEQNPSNLVTIKVNPELDPLHGHPRFRKLLARFGLANPQ